MPGKEYTEERAVVYARFSSSKQHETSIEGQLTAAHKYAETKGYKIIREYCDRAKTGTNDRRDEFQKMLSDCAKHQFSVIIVWKVDRFGRNREEITFNKYRAKKHGVRVEYVAENIVEGPEGVILESVLEGMAEYFSKQLSQNVQRGLLEAAKKHHVPGGNSVSYGYRAAADKTYEINPDTGPVVTKIFDMYAAGSTESEIVTWLNSQGYRTQRGAAFNRMSLVKMLKNERYIGTYTYKDIIRDENVIPPLVEKDVFRKVQEMLKVNKRQPSHRWTYSEYILTGKLFCGKCGASMVGRSGTGKAKTKYCYYQCFDQMHKKGCDKKAVRKEYIEDLVLERIHTVLDNQEIFDMIINKTWEFYLKEDADNSEEEALQNQLSAVEKGLQRLIKSVEDGMPYDLVKGRVEELEDQRTTIKKALEDHEIARAIKLTRDHIQFFLEKMRDADRTDPEAQKRLIDTFVRKIFVYDDHILITLNYHGNGNEITVNDIEKASTSDTTEVFECACSTVHEKATCEHFRILWFSDVIALEIPISKPKRSRRP